MQEFLKLIFPLGFLLTKGNTNAQLCDCKTSARLSSLLTITNCLILKAGRKLINIILKTFFKNIKNKYLRLLKMHLGLLSG